MHMYNNYTVGSGANAAAGSGGGGGGGGTGPRPPFHHHFGIRVLFLCKDNICKYIDVSITYRSTPLPTHTQIHKVLIQVS